MTRYQIVLIRTACRVATADAAGPYTPLALPSNAWRA